MPTTLASALADLRLRLAESTARFWSDTQLRTYINSGVRDVARKTETILKTADITVSANTYEYAAPADVQRINRVEWIPTGGGVTQPLEYRDYNNMDNVWWINKGAYTGNVYYFTMWGYPPALTIILHPVPAVAGKLKLYYYSMPTDLDTSGTADSSTLVVPEGWQDCVILHAEYLALRADSDPRWQEAKALYDEHINDLIAVTRRYSDQPGQFVERSSFLPEWLYGGW